MKPIAISSCLAFAALSLYAGDPQTTNTAPTAAHGEKLLSATRVVGGNTDSPLVRAAKATNRLNKKPGQVITNETLVRTGGHFTTTTAESQVPLPPVSADAPTMDKMAAEQRRARADAAARAATAQQQQRVSAAARAEQSPEALYGEPPALEAPPQPSKPIAPETMEQRKPPM
jgi:hypothetical protein